MKRPVRRLLVTLVALVCLSTGVAVPASAGPLTGATFSASPGWNTTGASGARYDWGFTTATTSTLSRVTASVPPGTTSVAERFLDVSGQGGNDARSADSPLNSVTGNIELTARAALANWNPPTDAALVGKWDLASSNMSYLFHVTPGGYLRLNSSSTGSNMSIFTSTTPVTAANGTALWTKATLTLNNGSGNAVTKFFTSNDGTVWTQLGSDATRPTIPNLFDGTASVSVGAWSNGTGGLGSASKIFYASVRNGIGGPIISEFRPSDVSISNASAWTSSTTGESWTLFRSATAPIDIASSLNVGPVEGLPSDGTANYRFIDGVATYNLPAATSVNAGTNVKLNLGGFTNTSTPGSYASTITTYNGSAAVDSATTGGLAFTATSGTSNATVSVDPSLTFTVDGDSGPCNGISSSSGASSSGTAVSLGRMSSYQPGTAVQRLTVSTNGGSGAVVSVRPSGSMSANTATIPHISGYRIAFPATGTAGFGLSMGWYSADQWTGLSNSLSTSLFSTASPGQGSHCVALRAQPASNSPAGNYTTALRYIATPRF